MEAKSAVERGELVRLRVAGAPQRNPIMLFTRADEAPAPAAAHFIDIDRGEGGCGRERRSGRGAIGWKTMQSSDWHYASDYAIT